MTSPWEYEYRVDKKIYTGVGARESPARILAMMSAVARKRSRSHIVRSGGARGADTAFECAQRKEIYLPFPNFNNKEGYHQYSKELTQFAIDVLNKVLPYEYNSLSPTTKAMFRRNVFQITGLPRDGIITLTGSLLCWTPDGAESAEEYVRGVTGGTGVAILIADHFDVPIYNLACMETYKQVLNYIKSVRK